MLVIPCKCNSWSVVLDVIVICVIEGGVNGELWTGDGDGVVLSE